MSHIDELMALWPDNNNLTLNETNILHSGIIDVEDEYPEMNVSSAVWLEIADIVNTNLRYTTPMIIVGGCVGNLMAVYVFRRTKKLAQQSSTYYLAALCLSDTLYLLLHGLLYLTTYQHLNVYNRSGLCEAITYLSSSASFISVWLVVAFTAERYVAVAHPLRRNNWCTSSRALNVLNLCMAVGATMNLPLLYFTDMMPSVLHNQTMCGLQTHKKVSIWARTYALQTLNSRQR